MEATKTRYFEAVGKRKTAIARVRITEAGKTGYTVNDQKLEEYFVVGEHRDTVSSVLKGLDPAHPFSVSVKVLGGGIHAQAVAARHGIARAILVFDKTYRKQLKEKGFLTRDPRAKERRKFGLKKARKAPQWSKR